MCWTEAKQIGLTSSKPKSTQKKPVCKCPKNVAPVCGKNGGTYGNTCMAKCAKTTVASKGPCKKPKKSTKKPKKTTLKKRYIPCNVNNGGCHKARKCTIFIGRKSKYTICSACAKPYINLGSTQCTMGEQTLGGENDDEAKNLKACTGECDADSQCAKGLKCFQRSKGEKIPGCKGNGGGKTWDYCYNPKGTKPWMVWIILGQTLEFIQWFLYFREINLKFKGFFSGSMSRVYVMSFLTPPGSMSRI